MAALFEVPEVTATIVFPEGHRYHGMEAECSMDIPLGMFQRFLRLADVSESDVADGGEFIALIEAFGDDVLVAWNAARDGERVPATGAGMVRFGVTFALTVVNQWLSAVTTVAAPLAEPSTAGESSEGQSIPQLESQSVPLGSS